MKVLNYITIYLTIVFTLAASPIFAQNPKNEEKLTDLEGTWFYKDERIDFTVTLVFKEVKVSETEKQFVLGYIKLIVDGNLVHNDLEFVEFLHSKDKFDFNEIFLTKNPVRTPPVIFSSNGKGIIGGFQIYEKTKGVTIEPVFQGGNLIWNFPSFVGPKRIIDPDHIPAVPSTWVLKRVEE
ncbi:DUF6705 family protein [Algoriphagus winogradskyi]|uniref:DUF6705 domain-containing protein n=1 Tax=Algoriphagus winogradskyi TaxID=237017 RepID=A0ABY1NXU7_9BACT|nr:DUF6705 family protein [Algoriphagus winogradskyi]SMP21453.1 hypothetical protein SAMN06265367_103304 [Algoriphagus winogradskyi]